MSAIRLIFYTHRYGIFQNASLLFDAIKAQNMHKVLTFVLNKRETWAQVYLLLVIKGIKGDQRWYTE